MKKQIACIFLAVILTVQFGVTVCAEDTETPIVPADSGVEINGLNIVLSGEIGLTFHVFIPKKYKGGTMEFTFMDKPPITMNIADCPLDNNLRYLATYYLSAVELSEKVTLTVFDSDHDPLAQESYSAEEYVSFLLKDENATEKEKNVGKALINYGHYAQLACSEANGWEIGKDYKETTAYGAPAVDPSVFEAYGIEWQNEAAALRRISMSLRLDYKTCIRLYLPLSEKPTVTVDGEAVEVTQSERLENNYEILIEGINVLNLNKKYEITVNDVTFTLSAFSYCDLAITHDVSENTVNAIRALYEFYQATVDYNEF